MLITGICGLMDGSLIQELRFDTTSNNLANLDTNGFKRSLLSFNEVLTMKSFSATDFSPGPITSTGNNLDVALDGPGFLKVQTPQGVRYTRNGALALNKEGILATQDGNPVLGERGTIKVHGQQVTIQRDGSLIVDGTPADKISLVQFKEPWSLRKSGFSYYTYDGNDQGVLPAEKTQLQQGYLEKSNVSVTEEMVQMVEAFRSFEAMQKAIQNMDEMTGKLVNEVGLN